MNGARFTAIAFACGLFVLQYTHACTTIIVGKQVAKAGKTIIARTSDTIDARRAKNLQFYNEKDGSRSYIGLPYADLAFDKNNDMAQVATNKYGVSISATETIQSNAEALRLDPPSTKEGVSEPNIPAIVMPTATSAQHAISILGLAIQERGVLGSKGFGVLIADSQEAWYLETLSGHQWVAIKIPQDVYFVAANGPGQIQEYTPQKYIYMLSDYTGINPIDFAMKQNIAQWDTETFNFRKTYADLTNPKNNNVNFVRLAYIQHLFNPESQHFDEATIKQAKFPMFLKPEKQILVNDIKKMQASHYQEFPAYDPYLREDKNESERTFYYPVANVRTSNGHITVVGNPLQDSDYSLANLEYIALGMPTISFYMPIYYGLTKAPASMQGATSEASSPTLFWQFRTLQALVFLSDSSKGIQFEFKKRSVLVQSAYEKLAEKIKQNRDTEILNLKLDELIKAHKGANNLSIDLSKLSDEELKTLKKQYEKICNKKTGS